MKSLAAEKTRVCYGFGVGTHPLLKIKDDIPAFLETQKAKFDELKALDVDTEHKMHPVKFIDIIMQCVGKYMRNEAQTYIRQLNTMQPFAFEQLQAIVSTYESSNFLMCTRSTAFQAAAMNALPCSRNRNLRFNQNPISMGAGAGSGHANAGHQPHQISAAEHRAASLGILASGRDYDQMQYGESYEHSGNGFNGSNRYISSVSPGAENRVDMHQLHGIPEDAPMYRQPRLSTPRLNDRERSYRDRQPHCPIRRAEKERGRSRSHENERGRSRDRSRGPSRERSHDRSRSRDRRSKPITWCIPIQRRMAVDRT